MSFTGDDIQANREFFRAKLRATRQITDIVAWAEGEPGDRDFVLLDVRDRESFSKGHIRGALCVPLDELQAWGERLSRQKELVVYCWNHT